MHRSTYYYVDSGISEVKLWAVHRLAFDWARPTETRSGDSHGNGYPRVFIRHNLEVMSVHISENSTHSQMTTSIAVRLNKIRIHGQVGEVE